MNYSLSLSLSLSLSSLSHQGEPLRQSVVIMFFSGRELRTLVERACISLDGRVYPMPETRTQQDALFQSLEKQYYELSQVRTFCFVYSVRAC